MPRSSRVRRLVLFVFILGGSLVGALVFALNASAQTSTPTPTVTPIWSGTPTPTVTPVFENPDPGWGDVVWWWVLDQGAAPVGTWADTVDVTRRVTCAGGSCYNYDPSGNVWTYVVLIPPAQTRVVTYTCTAAGIAVGVSGSGFSGLGYAYVDDVRSSTLTVSTLDGVLIDKTWTTNHSGVVTGTFRAVLGGSYSAWPGAETVPSWDLANGSTSGRYLQVSLKAAAGSTGDEGQSGASVRMVCQVLSVERFDGSTYVPRVPVAGDSDIEWVPWDDWDPIEWTDAPPTTGGFGFGDEVQGDCFTIVPGYQYTVPVPSWIGDDVPMGWPSREVCVIERDLDVVLFGMDLGQMVYVWVMLSAVFWMIGVWRRG